MLAFIVASHGEFAKGVVNSSYMIFGQQAKVETVTFAMDEHSEDLQAKYTTALAKFSPNDQVLFLVDLWGGSPFNVASRFVTEQPDRMGLITGVNLPMLIEAYTVRDRPLKEVIAHLEQTGRIGIKHLELFTPTEGDELA